MASSQDMVPTGQQYGDRQQNVAQLRAAGVPLNSAAAAPQPAPPGVPSPPAPGGQAPQGAPVDVGTFDVFANREPTPDFQPVPPRQVMFSEVQNSDNQVMQAIFQRMNGYKGV